MLEKKCFFFVFFHVSGMLEKKCFLFCVSGMLEKKCFFLLVSGMLGKKGVFCVGQVCLKKILFFFACVRYA